jgi:hypothetical protein
MSIVPDMNALLEEIKRWRQTPEAGCSRLIAALKARAYPSPLSDLQKAELAEHLAFIIFCDARSAIFLGRVAGELGIYPNVHQALTLRRSNPRGLDLIVDLASDRILKGKVMVISSPLARLLNILKHRDFADLSEIASSCFGLWRYDSLVHAPRIFNLLTRARKLLPHGLKLLVRDQRVYTQGSWKQVRFLEESAWSLQLKANAEWLSLISPEAQRKRIGAKFIGPQRTLKILRTLHSSTLEFDRHEIEKIAGVSKSKALRWITTWCKNGIIVPKGRGRKSSYLLKIQNHESNHLYFE